MAASAVLRRARVRSIRAGVPSAPTPADCLLPTVNAGSTCLDHPHTRAYRANRTRTLDQVTQQKMTSTTPPALSAPTAWSAPSPRAPVLRSVLTHMLLARMPPRPRTTPLGNVKDYADLTEHEGLEIVL